MNGSYRSYDRRLRLLLLPYGAGIAVLFERLLAEAESTVRAQLISATAATDAQCERVVKALKAKFQPSCRSRWPSSATMASARRALPER